MMPTLLRDARPTARREHRCSCCNGPIRPGLPYRRETYVYDGHVYDWKVCDPCESLTDLVWGWVAPFPDEGINRDDYIEWAREHRDDPKRGPAGRCPGWGRWVVMRGAGMAAAYAAGLGVLSWLAFKASAWGVDMGVRVWCRVKDNRQEKA